MDSGYVKLWRKSMDSKVWASPELWKLWSWCLMKASYKNRFVNVVIGKGSSTVELSPGEFIWGRHSCAKEFGWNPSTTLKRMRKLESFECIVLKSNTHYSIVTICNWEDYQARDEVEVTAGGQPSDSQVTTKGQPSDTNKKVNKVKKVKEVYGQFQNVFLSEEEISKLTEKFNGTCQDRIEALSEYQKSQGKKYKDHYATILAWDRRDKNQNPAKAESRFS